MRDRSKHMVSPDLSADKARDIACEAYIYAYPLVVMDVTREQMTNHAESLPSGTGPANRFNHAREFPDARFHEVIRVNVDTLYSLAWVDLDNEPMVLSIPKTDRYLLVPILSMWTDVFAVPGTRTTGTDQAQNILLLGPNYVGTLPLLQMESIRSPTRWVWIIGRIQTNGPQDYESVHSIQEGLRLIPLSAWGKADYRPAPATVDPKIDMKTPPPMQVRNMEPAVFFNRFVSLLRDNPPYFYDSPLLQRIHQIGISPSMDFTMHGMSSTIQHAIIQGVKDAQALIHDPSALGAKDNGWYWAPNGGFFGNNYQQRAHIAAEGIGMNLPQDAVYLLGDADRDGQALDGHHRYFFHFDKESTPPVDAFWSVTLYDKDGYLCENTMQRFALGNKDRLQRNADGSIDIYLQFDSPGSDKEANWLPVPKDQFNLALRLYSPRPEAIDHKWSPPAIHRSAQL